MLLLAVSAQYVQIHLIFLQVSQYQQDEKMMDTQVTRLNLGFMSRLKNYGELLFAYQLYNNSN
jgi:hypothetical protein